MKEIEFFYLGIDIGSVSIGYVLMNQYKQIILSEYIFHQGNILIKLKELLNNIDLSQVQQIVYTNKSADFFNTGINVNEQVAIIEGAHYEIKNVGSIFNIGGETFGLILFDEQNRYQKYISNSSCAAGTGAFLDQQAERLGLSGSAELSRLAETFRNEPPKIATRCAVFAKTDLIHCQQHGYSLEAISAGLCKGLAYNIADTLMKGITLNAPVAAVGGVSKNQKVIHYLSEIIGCQIIIPKYSEILGAIGCALIAHNQSFEQTKFMKFSTDTLLKKQSQNKYYFFPPLSSKLSSFPNFSGVEHFIIHNVEVDIYGLPVETDKIPVFLGIDIGSTSTKAIVMNAVNRENQILLGLYTRTKGQPIKATQYLLQVLNEVEKKYDIHFEFYGTGTTGSGRKFIQKVLNSDMAIDEITAHAKAAYILNPLVDTIIEIGGQDSKFTVLNNGQVTFSVMNYVCAAGTGSFIEEQAHRLNVPLDEYAERAMGVTSPLTSDRCTVFMEKDLNNFLIQGFSKNELLAAALHSVRDNYLSKVAHLNKIGDVICFQGATAKNKALVTAFEQKLEKPIFVSKYCHLTGALGVCLFLQEQGQLKSNFRGISFYKENPVVTEEVCDDCKNHCKLRKVKIGDENIVWGFLCGKDEDKNIIKSLNWVEFDLLGHRRKIFNPKKIIGDKTGHEPKQLQKSILEELKSIDFDIAFNSLKQSFEINLLNLRHKLFSVNKEEIKLIKEKKKITIGIPCTLYMHEFVPFWKLFFEKLGYSVIISTSNSDLLEQGKKIAGAEFCAPISYWHGHVSDLSGKTDYLFLPHMFEEADSEKSKYYCYYSNYAVVLIQNINQLSLDKKCITPIIDFSKPAIYNIQQIYENLPKELKFIQTPGDIQEAYISAWHWFTAQKNQLIKIFLQHAKNIKDISVVLLGRPYLIFDKEINKNIPQKFIELNVNAFSQDMLPQVNDDLNIPAKEFIDWNHWKFGSDILHAAEYTGKNYGLYPVFITAFKCSPDSFILNYFKDIMDSYQKPYLILQIDEHSSDVGYETRIESAIRSFRNHFTNKKSIRNKKNIQYLPKPFNKMETILIPNYDSLSCSLICAAFECAGYNPYLIEETPDTILSSPRLNDGQCLPISSIVQGAIETIQKNNLNPAATSIFLNVVMRLACNFPQYPIMAKKLLEQKGEGFEYVQIFSTEFDLKTLPLEVIYDIYCSYLLGGLVRRLGCKIRPYEIVSGQTDKVINKSLKRLYKCIAKGKSKEKIFKKVISDFKKISVNELYNTKPKVSIIGDLYVKDNNVFNQQLIYELENSGANVAIFGGEWSKHLKSQRTKSKYFWLHTDLNDLMKKDIEMYDRLINIATHLKNNKLYWAKLMFNRYFSDRTKTKNFEIPNNIKFFLKNRSKNE